MQQRLPDDAAQRLAEKLTPASPEERNQFFHAQASALVRAQLEHLLNQKPSDATLRDLFDALTDALPAVED